MIEAFFPVDPGALAINEAKRCKCVPIGRGKYKPASYTTDRHSAASNALHVSARLTWGPEDLPIYPDGPVIIEIESLVKRQHRQGAASGLPLIDDDAAVKAVRDALQGVAYTDDAQVIRTISSKSSIETTPCIRVRVYRPEEA